MTDATVDLPGPQVDVWNTMVPPVSHAFKAACLRGRFDGKTRPISQKVGWHRMELMWDVQQAGSSCHCGHVYSNVIGSSQFRG